MGRTKGMQRFVPFLLPGNVEPLITSQDHIDPFNKTA
jgi:hypothetical protein